MRDFERQSMEGFNGAGIAARRRRRICACGSWRALLAAFVLSLIGAHAQAAPKVVVTIKPVHALAAEVMEGVGEPVLLVEGAFSPHTFVLKPSDVRALNDARLFIRVSESVEPFTKRLVAALPDSVGVVTLINAPGILLLPKRRNVTFDGHGHAEVEGAGSHVHDHDGNIDGHIWLDPENAKAIVRTIAAALISVSPEDEPQVKANADRAIARLESLDNELKHILAPISHRPFVVFHDSLQYFERHFGLSAVAALSISPEVQPSVQRLRAVRSEILSVGASCVFSEPFFSDKLINSVIEGTDARVGVLDPDGLSVSPGPDAYDVLMRNVARSLRDCLGR